MRNFHRIFVLLALFSSVAVGTGAAETGASASFTGDFERGDLSDWNRESARADSIQVVTDPKRAGHFSAKFTVRAGEVVSNGNRAELTHDNGDLPGSQRWYAWSCLIPRDFGDVEWKPKLWQCIGQWHDQPDTARGETWETLPAHSPSIAVYYTSKKGASAIEVWYGTYGKTEDQKIVAVAPIEKGQWLDLKFHIRWSQNRDGFLEAFLNGKPLISPATENHRVFGANMWNGAPHYLKIGLYRSGEITPTNSVYFDEVRIGESAKKVALPAREAACQ